jgi:ribosomal protein RSM22 (predicted rRNA methylase)
MKKINQKIMSIRFSVRPLTQSSYISPVLPGQYVPIRFSLKRIGKTNSTAFLTKSSTPILTSPKWRNSLHSNHPAQVPELLITRLTDLLHTIPFQRLSVDFIKLQEVTNIYNSAPESDKVVVYTPRLSAAYLAYRMLPSFGIVHSVFSRLRDVGYNLPKNTNTVVLDFGSGPGSASWACYDFFDMKNKPQHTFEATLIDSSLPMIDAGTQLSLNVFETNWAKNLIELTRGHTLETASRFDLVIASFSLGELPSIEARQVTLELLWQFVKAETGILILIESGDARGAGIIGNARKHLLENNKPTYTLSRLFKESSSSESLPLYFPHVLAPCGHEKECPLMSELRNPSNLHCHFSQLVPRLLKPTTSQRTNHPMSYSYVILAKKTKPRLHNEVLLSKRVLTNPLKRSGHVVLDICDGNSELPSRTVLTRKKLGNFYFKITKNVVAGDLLPPIINK